MKKITLIITIGICLLLISSAIALNNFLKELPLSKEIRDAIITSLPNSDGEGKEGDEVLNLAVVKSCNDRYCIANASRDGIPTINVKQSKYLCTEWTRTSNEIGNTIMTCSKETEYTETEIDEKIVEQIGKKLTLIYKIKLDNYTKVSEGNLTIVEEKQ